MASRPMWLTRQVVSRPAPVGEQNSRNCQVVISFQTDQPRGAGAIQPDERSVARLRQELRIYEGTEQRVTDVALQPPQPLGLGRCQTQPGHFHELALDPLKHIVHTHTCHPFPGPNAILSISEGRQSNQCTEDIDCAGRSSFLGLNCGKY